MKTNQRALYTIQRCRKNDTRYGRIHFSNDARETLCGMPIDSNWWILTNKFDGEATCPKCINQCNRTTP